MYLPVDSKSNDYQFVYLDLANGFGIACKFKFDNKDGHNMFSIVRARKVISTHSGVAYQTINKLSANTEINDDSEYGLQIKVDLTAGTEDIDKDRTDLQDCPYTKKVDNLSNNGKHIIDVHLDKLAFNTDLQEGNFRPFPVSKHGPGFCRFYIV